MRLIAAILYYLAGILWLIQCFEEVSFIKLVIGLLWIAGGVSLTIRYIRSKQPPKEE